MAGYTDVAFRLLLRRLGGVGLTFTEMLHPRTLVGGGGKRRRQLLATDPADIPLGHQIYGPSPDLLIQGARWLQDNGATLIDINMGCPQKKIAGVGSGAGLLRDPEKAVRIAEAVVKCVTLPVTIKIRLGWDPESPVAEWLATRFEAAGVAALTVHGRTRSQGFTGSADWEAIGRVVRSVKTMPVIGNGDVVSPAKAMEFMQNSGCAGLMIGRGALKRPWVFRDIARALAGTPPCLPPTPDEVVEWAEEQLERMKVLYGEKPAILLFRKWIPQYAPALKLNRENMVALLQLTDPEEFRDKFRLLTGSAYKDLKGASGLGGQAGG
jgi:nifR3 family TIM-barrel protein